MRDVINEVRFGQKSVTAKFLRENPVRQPDFVALLDQQRLGMFSKGNPSVGIRQ